MVDQWLMIGELMVGDVMVMVTAMATVVVAG